MSCRVVVRPAAEADLLNHYVYLATNSETAAQRFLVSVRKTLQTLAAMPDVGTSWRSETAALQNIRYYPVQGFANHLIFYHRGEQVLEVLHVYHGSRDVDHLLSEGI